MDKAIASGKVAEERFKDWLDHHHIPYWYIRQDLDSFSPGLKKYFTKRPDFMILIPNFGFFLVDVERKTPAEKKDQFFMNAREVNQYLQLQKLFNLHVWYAISNEMMHFGTWYWMPASRIVDIGVEVVPQNEILRRSMRGAGWAVNEPEDRELSGWYYEVPIKEFIQLSTKDSLERLLSNILQANE